MEYLMFEKEYRVHVNETRTDSRLNLHSLFDYFQDIASDHSVQIGFGRYYPMKQNHFCLLSRIFADISVWPSLSDTTILKTWPRGTDRFVAIKDYEARYTCRSSIACATSSWLIIDMDFIPNNVPLSAEINYLAESRFNNSIATTITEESNNINGLNHSIISISDNTELCRIRINWEKNQI